MKVMSIRIKSNKEAGKEFVSAWKAAEKGQPYKVRSGTFFTSLEAVRKFLTPKRLELLHLIKERHPRSIYELAKMSGRSFSSVFRDIETLENHGLVKSNHPPRTSRRAVQLEVEYDELDVKLTI